jgi:hypothetical protein
MSRPSSGVAACSGCARSRDTCIWDVPILSSIWLCDSSSTNRSTKMTRRPGNSRNARTSASWSATASNPVERAHPLPEFLTIMLAAINAARVVPVHGQDQSERRDLHHMITFRDYPAGAW